MLRARAIALVAAAVLASPGGASAQSIWDGSVIPVTGDAAASVGPSLDQSVMAAMRANDLPGLTVAITKNGRLVYNRGFGFAHWENGRAMSFRHRTSIGSVSKALVALGMMGALEDASADLDRRIYGPGGILPADSDFRAAYVQGNRRHFPIVGLTIGRNNRVIAWYSDGTFTIGDSADLTRFQEPEPYVLPAGQLPEDIVGMARGGPDNRVFTWYRDRTFSVGTPDDLGAFSDGDTFVSRRPDHIVGMAADTRENVFYAYHHDGSFSSGVDPADLTSRWDSRPYVVPGQQSRRYDIVDLARSDNDVMVVWFSEGKVSKGNADDLGRITDLSDYVRKAVPNSIGAWNAAYASMTLRHLMSHTAGFDGSGEFAQAEIKYGLTGELDGWPPLKVSNAYVISTRKLLWRPGEGYRYSNHGFGLLGHLLETATGEPWHAYLSARIFKPAGAQGIVPAGMNNSDVLDSYPHQVGAMSVTTLPQVVSADAGSPAGALKATARDLVAVMAATDRLLNRPDVLTAATLDEMETRPFPSVAPNVAIGWHVVCQDVACDAKRLWHNGDKPGEGSAFIAKYQGFESGNQTVSGVTVAIAVNRPGAAGPLGSLANSLARTVAGATIVSDFFLGGLQGLQGE